LYSDIILIHYQQTSNPAASLVKDNKIPSHTSTPQIPFAVIVPITPRREKRITLLQETGVEDNKIPSHTSTPQIPFAVIVPITPRTPKESTRTQVKVISSPSSTSKTIGNPPSNLAILPGMTNDCAQMDEWNVKEIDAVDADSTSNPAAASPVTVKKMPITPRTPKESTTEMLQDAVPESQSMRFEDFQHQDRWKSMALLQETGVEKEDNDEEMSSDDDGEERMVLEIVKNEDGNMVDREGTRVEVEDPDSLEAPYLEVCTTNASISILFFWSPLTCCSWLICLQTQAQRRKMTELSEMEMQLEEQVKSLASIEKSEIEVRLFYLYHMTSLPTSAHLSVNLFCF
jgi:hypothetical protein